MKCFSTTNEKRDLEPMKTRKSEPLRFAQSHSRKKPLPGIWVHYQNDRGLRVQAHAHLQVPADGCLYLVWREGARSSGSILVSRAATLRKLKNLLLRARLLQELAGGRRPVPQARGDGRRLCRKKGGNGGMYGMPAFEKIVY